MDFSIHALAKTLLLFVMTALCEILGCYFPYLILNEQKSHWLWVPTAISLFAFVYVLTLHPDASSRIYAMYGGVYVATALVWLRVVDKIPLTAWDMAGALVVLLGALIIIVQPR